MTFTTTPEMLASFELVNAIDMDALMDGISHAVEALKLSEAAAHERELAELSDAIAAAPTTKTTPRQHRGKASR